jgi:hypothetical protein
MTTQLVKKNFGGKRKGYKGSKWKDTAKGVGAGALTWGGWDLLTNILNAMPGKDGGRVTKRGIGKAKRGLGKVMGKK